jgi:hypothetical protein
MHNLMKAGVGPLVAGLLVLGCATPGAIVGGTAGTGAPARNGVEAQRAFFENMRELCGNTYGGRTILAPPEDRTFEPARLYFVVESCEPTQIRMPFTVDGDASRTLVLTLSDQGLLFTHEHRREDGTEYEDSGFGGWSDGRGSE